MTVRVVFDITHTKNGFDVKPEIVNAGQEGCVCEVAFATQTVENITCITKEINEVVNADPSLRWSGCYGC